MTSSEASATIVRAYEEYEKFNKQSIEDYCKFFDIQYDEEADSEAIFDKIFGSTTDE